MNLRLKRNEITAIVLFILFSIAILSSQRHFIDDMGRSVDGYFGLSDNGRPFADLLVMIVSFGTNLADSGSWIQIISIPIFLSIPFVVSKFSEGKIPPLAFIAAIINPFIIENMMYRYDSISMSYSLFSSIFSCLLINKGWKYYALSFLMLTSSIASYQASMSSFIVLSIMLFITDNGCNFKKLAIRAFIFALSYFCYSSVIAPLFIKGNYTKQYSQLIDFNNPIEFINNTSLLLKFCSENAGGMLLILFYLSIFFCFCSLVYARISNRIGSLKLLLSLVLLPLMISMPILVLSVLKYPFTAPRVLMSLGVSFACILSIPCTINPIAKKVAFVISIISSIVAINMAFVVSASNNAQMRYDDALSSQILNTMQHVKDSGGEVKSIGFIGYMQPSEISKRAFLKYHIAETLTPLYIKGNWWWGNYMLQLRGINLKRVGIDQRSYICKNPKKGIFYNYSYEGETLILDFSKKTCR